MIRTFIQLSCNDCDVVFGQSNFSSVTEANEAAIEAGWEVRPIHAVFVHFCKECQLHSMKANA